MKQKYKRKRRNKCKRIGTLLMLLFIAAIMVLFSYKIIPQLSIQKADIVLDAGHGGHDPGAIQGDIYEKNITLEILKITEEILTRKGYRVACTRTEDLFISLENRASFANRANAKIFVSIHCNSSESGGKGIETFYCDAKGTEDERLAAMIQNSLIEQTEALNRDIKTANYTVISNTQMPAVLVEAGFMTNVSELELLQQKEYQNKIAFGIAEGIERYLNSTQPPKM